jgi:hypothetical protein
MVMCCHKPRRAWPHLRGLHCRLCRSQLAAQSGGFLCERVPSSGDGGACGLRLLELALRM